RLPTPIDPRPAGRASAPVVPAPPPPPVPDAPIAPWFGRVSKATALYAAVYALLAFGPWLGRDAVRVVTNVGLLPVSALTCLLALKVARDRRSTPAERGAWSVLGLAFACTFLGDAAWAALETFTGGDPTYSWVNVPYLAYYPLLL